VTILFTQRDDITYRDLVRNRDPEHIAVIRVGLPSARRPSELTRRLARLRRRVATLVGVSART
jgi:hypothetical protein